MDSKIDHIKFPAQVFITGTDTGVGKSLVSAILMSGLKGAYWKPVQSGLDGPTDTEWVREKTGLPDIHFLPETYRLTRPLSPHASAAHDGVEIDLETFKIPADLKWEHLIIEGAGGIMVPLNREHLMLDLMKKLGSPILLVASSSLGTINHTLLSIEHLRRAGLDIMGVVMNGEKNAINRGAIEHFGKIQVLAEIEPVRAINAVSLKRVFEDHFLNI